MSSVINRGFYPHSKAVRYICLIEIFTTLNHSGCYQSPFMITGILLNMRGVVTARVRPGSPARARSESLAAVGLRNTGPKLFGRNLKPCLSQGGYYLPISVLTIRDLNYEGRILASLISSNQLPQGGAQITKSHRTMNPLNWKFKDLNVFRGGGQERAFIYFWFL